MLALLHAGLYLPLLANKRRFVNIKHQERLSMSFPFGDQDQLFKIIDVWAERHFTGNYLDYIRWQIDAAVADLKVRLEQNMVTPDVPEASAPDTVEASAPEPATSAV